MKKYNKGFTLIELLAVIIILSVIMVFSVPAILNASNNAQSKSFKVFANRVASLAYDQVAADKLLDLDIAKNDKRVLDVQNLGLKDVGDYRGCIVATQDSTESQSGIISQSTYTLTVYLTNGKYCTPTKGILSNNISNSNDVQSSGCRDITYSACSGSGS